MEFHSFTRIRVLKCLYEIDWLIKPEHTRSGATVEVGIEYKFHLKYIQTHTHTRTSVLVAFVVCVCVCVCVLGYFEIFVLICCGNDANNAANFEPEPQLIPHAKAT